MSESLWNRCLRVLESELPMQQFNTWVRPLQAIERDGELRLAGAESVCDRVVGRELSAADPRTGAALLPKARPRI